MKKAIFIFFLIFLATLSFAQVSFAGNPQYGQLRNFVYDKVVPNKVYATTFIDKNIMVSTDNGVTWNVLYTLPYPAFSGNISQVRLTNNGTALSFIQYFGSGSSLNKIIVLDLQSLTPIKEYSAPANEDIYSISNYTIHDDGTMNNVSMLANDKFFTTNNGGNTWTRVYDGTDYEGVLLNDAVMDPQNIQKLFVVRNGGPGNVDGGLMISTDSGATWTEKLNGLILQTIAIDPQNSDIIYVGTGLRWAYLDQHEAVYKSTDGGNTWTEQTGITWETGSGLKNVPKIEINPNDTNHVVVLADDRVAVTTNGGATWTSTPHDGLVDGYSYFYGINAAFNPNDPNHVLISNNRYAKSSNDKGMTLTTMTNPFFNCMGKVDIIKNNDGEDQLMYGVQYGYVLKNLVSNQETPLNVYPLSEFPMGQEIKLVYPDKKHPGRVYTYAPSFMGNMINVSDDYGLTETPLYSTFDTGFTAAESDPANPNIVWMSTFNGETATLIKSDFTNRDNPINDFITLPYDGDYLQGIKINQSNSNEILITVGNQILKTTNGGTSWTRITAGLEELTLPNIAISLTQNPLNSNQYTIAASNGIYTSLDSGNTWTKIYTGLVHKVEHSTEKDGQIVAIGTIYFDTLPKVIYTNNGGANWTERASSNYYNSIIISGTTRFTDDNKAEVFLATTSLGVLKDVIDFTTLGTSVPQVIKDNISVYPNPTQDIINIKLDKNVSKFKASLYNAAGQVLLTTENRSSIDISNLSKGVYFMKIEPENGKPVTKKIIKN